VQLVDVASGKEVCTEALKEELQPSEQTELNSTRRVNMGTYDLYLRGLEKHSEFNAACECFTKATKLDKGYARAFASTALPHAIDVNMN